MFIFGSLAGLLCLAILFVSIYFIHLTLSFAIIFVRTDASLAFLLIDLFSLCLFFRLQFSRWVVKHLLNERVLNDLVHRLRIFANSSLRLQYPINLSAYRLRGKEIWDECLSCLRGLSLGILPGDNSVSESSFGKKSFHGLESPSKDKAQG